MPSLFESTFGHGPRERHAPNYSPEAQQTLQNLQTGQTGIEQSPLYQAGSDWLLKLLSGDTSVFEQPLMQQFNEQIVPGIAERFGGMGAGSSSALNQSIAQAGSTLSQQIAALRGGLMNQASEQALGYANQPYANQLSAFQFKPHENYVLPGTTGHFDTFMHSWAGSAGNNIGKWANPQSAFMAG